MLPALKLSQGWLEIKKIRHSVGEYRNYSCGTRCTRWLAATTHVACCNYCIVRSASISQVRIRLQYSFPILDFRITNIRYHNKYWGGSGRGRSPPENGNGGSQLGRSSRTTLYYCTDLQSNYPEPPSKVTRSEHGWRTDGKATICTYAKVTTGPL